MSSLRRRQWPSSCLGFRSQEYSARRHNEMRMVSFSLITISVTPLMGKMSLYVCQVQVVSGAECLTRRGKYRSPNSYASREPSSCRVRMSPSPDSHSPIFRQPGKSAIDLIIDFLSCLWEYAKEQITRDIGAVADLGTNSFSLYLRFAEGRFAQFPFQRLRRRMAYCPRCLGYEWMPNHARSGYSRRSRPVVRAR